MELCPVLLQPCLALSGVSCVLSLSLSLYFSLSLSLFISVSPSLSVATGGIACRSGGFLPYQQGDERPSLSNLAGFFLSLSPFGVCVLWCIANSTHWLFFQPSLQTKFFILRNLLHQLQLCEASLLFPEQGMHNSDLGRTCTTHHHLCPPTLPQQKGEGGHFIAFLHVYITCQETLDYHT